MKTAKSWKKLEVKQNAGDNVDIEKGNTRPRPRRTIQVSNNNGKEDNVSAVQSIMREPVNNNPVNDNPVNNNNKSDIVETNDKAVQEPEPELEPEQDLTLQIEDNVDEFLNGIESAEKP